MYGEALGLYHTIQWVHDLQLAKLDFEVDSKRVADYFKHGSGDLTEFGTIMKCTIHYCKLHLENSHVEFIRMQVNMVANALAGKATSLAGKVNLIANETL